MSTPGLKTHRFPGAWVLQYRLDRTFSSPSWRTDIQTILLTTTLLTNPGLQWTFLEVARRNFSNSLGFIILQAMVCSKEQSSLIPQYKRHLSRLSHQTLDLRPIRAASDGKQKTRLSWSSYGPIISNAWKARTVGKLGMKSHSEHDVNKVLHVKRVSRQYPPVNRYLVFCYLSFVRDRKPGHSNWIILCRNLSTIIFW